MFRLYELVKATNQRPSRILNVVDEWAAYQFDQAVVVLGQQIDSLLAQRDPKTREPRWQLQDLLEGDLEELRTNAERSALDTLKAIPGLTTTIKVGNDGTR